MRARGTTPWRGRLAVVLMLALPLAGLVVSARPGMVAAATVNETIQNFAYHGPTGTGSFTIPAGTTVTWTN